MRAPDIDGWKKLKHCIKYFRATVNLLLILGADGTGILKCYVDASFAVHANMQGYTGGALMMGQGFPIVSLTKHKINTQSSTESQLVGVDDMISLILWSRYFFNHQG